MIFSNTCKQEKVEKFVKLFWYIFILFEKSEILNNSISLYISQFSPKRRIEDNEHLVSYYLPTCFLQY